MRPVGRTSSGALSSRLAPNIVVTARRGINEVQANIGGQHQSTRPQFVPVESFQAGDMLILRTLLDSRHNRNMTCEDILDELHGIGNHTTEQWTRYLLRYIVTIELGPHKEESTSKVVQSSPTSMTQSRLPTGSSFSGSRDSTLVSHNDPVAEPSTFNQRRSPSSISDMYTDAPVQRLVRQHNSRTRNNDDSEPEDDGGVAHSDPSGSRSPTPPMNPQMFDRTRYLFTKEDTTFLTKLSRRMINKDPNTTQHQIAEIAGTKAPHHSVHSWASYIHKHPKFSPHTPRARPNVVVVRSLDSLEDADASGEDSDRPAPGQIQVGARAGSPSLTEDTVDIIVDPPAPDAPGDATEDEKNMGNTHSRYNAADQRVLARYIVQHPEWHERSLVNNIRLFYQEYQVRTEDAWKHYYSMNKDYIDQLASGMKLQKRRNAKGKGRAGFVANTSRRGNNNGSISSPSSQHPFEQGTLVGDVREDIVRSSRTYGVNAIGEDARTSSQSRRTSHKRKAPESGFDSDDSRN
ncbi:hypothetical protein BDY19DRAFT_988583 [Irpex rosettiformis]|uniref:Uncharacterized protein n=1 Tax=Irpex rosettiformis TaxID=378272 RepID=A0ACB8UKQ4_9APHY|nr:hypothetical protein BDY19DRAFT_988583 [Irpex rosettiformis]